MRRNVPALLAGLAALALGLAGCGASPATGPSSNPAPANSGSVHDGSLTGIHACSLVSAAALKTVFGQPIAPVKTSLGGPENCFYQPAGAGGFQFPITLTVIERSAYDSAKQAATQSEPQGYKYAPISGVGDDAYSIVSNATFELDAARGGLAVRINTSGTSPISQAGQTRLVELLKSAIGSLG
jgi:hypothetical protein